MSLKATRDPRSLPSPLSVHPTTRRVPRPLPFLLLLFAPFALWPFSAFPEIPGYCLELWERRGALPRVRVRGAARLRRVLGTKGGSWSGWPCALRPRSGGGRWAPLRLWKAIPPLRVLPRVIAAPPDRGGAESECEREPPHPEVASVWEESSHSGNAAPRSRSRRPLV